MTATYAWIIDKDHTYDTNTTANLNAIGVTGPRNADPELLAQLSQPTTGTPFRLYDDDDILYYEGRIIGEFDGFEPLDDFGEPNAGCTGIRYSGDLL